MKKIFKFTFMTIIIFTIGFIIMLKTIYGVEYQNGTYSVPIKLSESGMNHNRLVSPTTVTVRDGVYYVDLIFQRVSGHGSSRPPQYAWVNAGYGQVGPSYSNTSDNTEGFLGVQVGNLNSIHIITLTTAMSSEHEVEYDVSINTSNIPQIAETTTTVSNSGNSADSSSKPSAKTETSEAKDSLEKEKDEKKKEKNTEKVSKREITEKEKTDVKEQNKENKVTDKKITADKKKKSNRKVIIGGGILFFGILISSIMYFLNKKRGIFNGNKKS